MTMTPEPDDYDQGEDEETVNIPDEDTPLETEGDPDVPADPMSPPASPGVS